MKLSPSGDIVWATALPGGDLLTGVGVTRGGDVYTGGHGPHDPASGVLVGPTQPFAAKLDGGTGVVRWAVRFAIPGSSDAAFTEDLAVTPVTEAVYLTGRLFQDGFLARVSRDGAVEWARLIRSPFNSGPFGVAADPSDGAWITGERLFDGVGVTGYAARFDPAGNEASLTLIAGEGLGRRVATDLCGNAYIAGETFVGGASGFDRKAYVAKIGAGGLA